ncbi:MAG: type II secretion system F family protein [Gemmataceae bacterium]|nr:type II secretion system F family protein [Gemmataceae bacterium]
MPDFTYEAMAGTGARTAGTLTAGSEREAMAILDSRGLFPLRVQAAATQSTLSASVGGGKVKTSVMATFFGQLADLLRAGVPLLRCMEILQKQSTQPALNAIIREVHRQVADGISLADAMAQHPKAFNELTISMIRAGQEGGFLEDVLERIAIFMQHQEDLKAKVVSALAYPVFLAVAMTLVVLVLVIFFVPKFEPIFKKLDAKGELPGITIALLGFSRFLIDYWWLIFGGLAVGFAGFAGWARTDAGRWALDRFRIRAPLAGKIYLNLALSRFARILGTLLHNGIPILSALRIGKDSTGNRVLAEAINSAADNVTAGNSLAAPLGACPYFPPEIVEMVSVGEESNRLEKVLLGIADGLEKRTSRQLELFVRLLEPIMLLVMAGVTLFVVAALLIPVFKMSATLQ